MTKTIPNQVRLPLSNSTSCWTGFAIGIDSRALLNFNEGTSLAAIDCSDV